MKKLFLLFVLSSFLFSLPVFSQVGMLDPSFGIGGISLTPLTGHIRYNAIARQKDGKIIVAGEASLPDGHFIAVARYLQDGSLDQSFSEDGTLITSFSMNFSFVAEIAVQDDNKIILGGNFIKDFPINNFDFAVMRLNPDGSLDPSFAGDGIQTTDVSMLDNVQTMAVQPDGKIVLAGFSIGTDYDFTLVRYNKDGSLDQSFSGDGVASTEIGGINSPIPGFRPGEDVIQKIAFLPGGKILAAGATSKSSPTRNIGLAMFNADGSLDNSFAGDGTRILDVNNGNIFQGHDEFVRNLIPQPDGTVLLLGTAYETLNPSYMPRLLLARIGMDGSLQPSFSGDSLFVTTFGFNALQPGASVKYLDGKLILFASYHDGTTWRDLLARINDQGVLDNSFGAGGMVLDPIPGSHGLAAFLIYKDRLFGASYMNNTSTDQGMLAAFKLEPCNVAMQAFLDPTDCFTNSASLSLTASGGMAPYAGIGDFTLTPGTYFKTVEDAVGCTDTNTVIIPDAIKTTYYRDADNDGFGDANDSKQACATPFGYVSTNTDCDDTKQTVHIGANEICGNGIDDNCNGQTDEDCTTQKGLNIDDLVVYEASGRANLRVWLSEPSRERVWVTLTTVEGTATEKGQERDYKSHTAHAYLEPGTTSTTVSLVIIQDDVKEENEYFDVVLSKPFGASIAKGVGRVTIVDDNPAARTKAQQKTEISLQAYPNPSPTSFTVKVTLDGADKGILRVVDVLGRVVEQFNALSSGQSLQIGANYGPGLYLLQLVEGDKTREIKLVKQTQ